MIKRVPTIINVSVKDLDANLGYIQKEFKLKGEHTYIHTYTHTPHTERVQTQHTYIHIRTTYTERVQTPRLALIHTRTHAQINRKSSNSTLGTHTYTHAHATNGKSLNSKVNTRTYTDAHTKYTKMLLFGCLNCQWYWKLCWKPISCLVSVVVSLCIAILKFSLLVTFPSQDSLKIEHCANGEGNCDRQNATTPIQPLESPSPLTQC